MAMVDVDGGGLPAESQPTLIDLVSGLSATWHKVCIHQMSRVNSRKDYGLDGSTINCQGLLLLLSPMNVLQCFDSVGWVARRAGRPVPEG